MKVHEATEAVLVRGTPEQVAAVEQAIQALTPSPEELMQEKVEQMTKAELARISSQVKSLAESHGVMMALVEKLKLSTDTNAKEITAIRELLNSKADHFLGAKK